MPDPRYAMRLAYSGVWDNGLNVLTTVTIP
jgi:hypothetical protein